MNPTNTEGLPDLPKPGSMACTECGMLCEWKEFHPFAACLMFKACHNSETVRANLDFVREAGRASHAAPTPAVDAVAWQYRTGAGDEWCHCSQGVIEKYRRLGYELRPLYLAASVASRAQTEPSAAPQEADALRDTLLSLGYSDTAVKAMGDDIAMMERAVAARAALAQHQAPQQGEQQ